MNSTINEFIHAVNLYLTGRSIVLQALSESNLSYNVLADSLNLSLNSLSRRRKNPGHWKPNEINKLADLLGLSTEFMAGLSTLAFRLMMLPVSVRVPLLKECRITRLMLLKRGKNIDNWLYHDLQQMTTVLRRWEDHHTIELYQATESAC